MSDSLSSWQRSICLHILSLDKKLELNDTWYALEREWWRDWCLHHNFSHYQPESSKQSTGRSYLDKQSKHDFGKEPSDDLDDINPDHLNFSFSGDANVEKCPKGLRFRPIDNSKLASSQMPGELSYSVMEGYDFQWVAEKIYLQMKKWYGSKNEHHFPRKVIREGDRLCLELHPMRFVVFDADRYVSSPSNFSSPSKSQSLSGKGEILYFSRQATIDEVTHRLASRFRKRSRSNNGLRPKYLIAEEEEEIGEDQEETRFRIWVGPVPPHFSFKDCNVRPQKPLIGSPLSSPHISTDLDPESMPLSPCSPKLTAMNVPLQLQEDYTGVADPFVLLQPTHKIKKAKLKAKKLRQWRTSWKCWWKMVK